MSCEVTHPQMIEGRCPWCERGVVRGVVDARRDIPGPVRWNWEVIAENLRNGDWDVCIVTHENLAEVRDSLADALAALEISFADSDRVIWASAERACTWIGNKLTRPQARRLEEQVAAGNGALAARIVLLEYYFLKRGPLDRAARSEHIFWLIEHHPERDVAGAPLAQILKGENAGAYQRGKELWLDRCVAGEASAAVLGNAAHYFLLEDREIAEKLLRSAQTRDPENPRWHDQLAQLYKLAADHGPVALRPGRARQALVELEMAEQLSAFHAGLPTDEQQHDLDQLPRMFRLPQRARAAFAAGELQLAKELAEECLALATSDNPDGSFRNDGNAIHYSHLVLGQVALERGDVEGAKRHLVESGKTEGSPNLGSFGPNMALAKELLERGEQDVVLEYLDLCANFWELGADYLSEWKSAISEGRIPWFGANLHY